MDQNYRNRQRFPKGGKLKCYTCPIMTLFQSKICSNSFLKIMFNKHGTCYISKVRYWHSFILRQSQGFLLEIHNHSLHAFSQYSKEDKRCQNDSNFIIPLNPIQARVCLPFKSPGGGL